jgi:glycosyltransferase involved in cell wall biosynthesis
MTTRESVPEGASQSCPAISVILPVWDAEPYLKAAIDSIIAQTFVDFEFLIVDDGSTDGSLGTAESYADARIQVISRQHSGLVSTLNEGLMRARGKYVARMDADDTCATARLERQFEFLERHPNMVLAGSWYYTLDEDGVILGSVNNLHLGGRAMELGLRMASPFVHGSVVMRRDAVLRVGGYREAFQTAEDYDLWLRLSEIGSVANVPEPLYALRYHPKSKTALEGGAVERFRDLAQDLAVQRLLEGRDALGHRYGSSEGSRAGAHTYPRSPSRAEAAVAWAVQARRRRRFRLAFRLVRQAIHGHPFDLRVWTLLAWYFLTPGRARSLGSLAVSKARQLFDRTAKRRPAC